MAISPISNLEGALSVRGKINQSFLDLADLQISYTTLYAATITTVAEAAASKAAIESMVNTAVGGAALRFGSDSFATQIDDAQFIVEDKDGDGTFETKKTFAENLNLISGLEIGFGGGEHLVGDVAGDLGKADQLSAVVPDGINNHMGPEMRAVFANAPAFFFKFAMSNCCVETFLRIIIFAVFWPVEFGKMLANNFFRSIALDAFGTGIPVGYPSLGVQHVNGIVRDALHQQARFGVAAEALFDQRQRAAGPGAEPLGFLFRASLLLPRIAESPAQIAAALDVMWKFGREHALKEGSPVTDRDLGILRETQRLAAHMAQLPATPALFYEQAALLARQMETRDWDWAVSHVLDAINRSKGGIPDDIPEVSLSGVTMGIGALLKAAGLAPSTSEANRLIEGGGVRIDGAVVSDKGLKVEAGTFVVQVGKRKFAKVTLA